MLSLYIHIPFCETKCKYCSFFVAPGIKDKQLIENYYTALLKEIDIRSSKLKDKIIKTIYLGGGTPLFLGKEKIFGLVDFIKDKFDIDYLEEISIELNPNPYSQILDFVRSFTKRYKNFYRIRFSFGIQTFNDDILIKSGRGYIFNTLIGFLRDLQKIKWINNVFNFDFIAFGIKEKGAKGQCFWKPHKCDFFEKFVNSHFADSFSVYMLELSPGSYRHDVKEIEFSEEGIYEEFLYLKNVIKKAGYRRYEISNFALPGKESLHNLVYWKLGNWLGLGINSSSYLNWPTNIIDKNTLEDILGIQIDNKVKGIKFQNTTSWKKYFEGKFIDKEKIELRDDIQYLYHKFIMGIRLKEGISNIKQYEPILVPDYRQKIAEFEREGLVKFENDKLALTDRGMDVASYVINELVK